MVLNNQNQITRTRRFDVNNLSMFDTSRDNKLAFDNLIDEVMLHIKRFGNPTIKGLSLLPHSNGDEICLWTTPTDGFHLTNINQQWTATIFSGKSDYVIPANKRIGW
jgi:hypothetical protein